jgi:hypothetical protein
VMTTSSDPALYVCHTLPVDGHIGRGHADSVMDIPNRSEVPSVSVPGLCSASSPAARFAVRTVFRDSLGSDRVREQSCTGRFSTGGSTIVPVGSTEDGPGPLGR